MTVLPFPGVRAPTTPIAHYLRVGHSGHLQLGSLQAKGRFPARRVVFNASRLKFQKDLVSALKAAGCEIVLDTDVAELSALARFDGMAATAPWAKIGEGSPLRPEHFRPGHPKNIIGEIARFAIENDVAAVLAPGHFLRNGYQDEWFDVDRESCKELRKELDRAGGAKIKIDYMLIPAYTQLCDEAVRGAFLSGLQDLPFEFLWVRASGMGADGTPLGARRYVTALTGLHNLGKPVIADNIGGLIGVATVVFGATSGIAHGVGQAERCNAGSWDKPRKKKDDGQSGGSQTRVILPMLDRSATIEELRLLSEARGGHRLVVCNDRACCPHGLEDMTTHWREHYLFQRFGQLSKFEEISDQARTRHFLDNDMAQADRIARQVKELKIADQELLNRLAKHSRRIESMRSTLEHLSEALGYTASRARAAIKRDARAGGDTK